MISDAIALVDFLSREATNRQIKSALFSWDGIKIEGSDEVDVVVSKISETHWFYTIKELEGYEFLYLPVIPSVYVDYALVDGQPDAKAFRFVANMMSNFQEGGLKNVKVNFLVYGYKPSDLLELRRNST